MENKNFEKLVGENFVLCFLFSRCFESRMDVDVVSEIQSARLNYDS